MQRLRSSITRAGLVAGSLCLASMASNPALAVPDGSPSPMRAAPMAPDLLPGSASTNLLTAADNVPKVTLVADAEPSIIAGNPVTVPLKWTGKYITGIGDGHAIACTAQFITQRVILLAAHCVREHATGNFYPINQAKFLLQYQNDDFSKEYHVVCRATWNMWPAPLRQGEDPSNPDTMTPERLKEYQTLLQHSWQWDYAFVLLDGESITGHYNFGINSQWNAAVATGYPHNLMGGMVIQAISGDVFGVASVAYSQGDEQSEQVLWQGNPDLTQGASGGAWVVHYSAQVSPDTNIIIGLNSYGVDNKPGANFGPLFTDNFVTLLNYVQNGCK